MTSMQDLIGQTTVHSRLYTDGAIFAEEMHSIFAENWVFVAHHSEIPQRGDFIRREDSRWPGKSVEPGMRRGSRTCVLFDPLVGRAAGVFLCYQIP